MEHELLKIFGQDHHSTLLYVETRCVDHGGLLEKVRMRCNPQRHPELAHEGGWSDSYSSRWAPGTDTILGHDDWDCIDDLEKAGLLHQNGLQIVLTDQGWRLAHELRRLRAERSIVKRLAPSRR